MTIADLATMDLTDESIADRVSPDFILLAPDDEAMAGGIDGFFDAGDRWTLASASVDFEAQGVAVGNLCKLESSSLVNGRTAYANVGLFAVVAPSGHNLTLRRRRRSASVGQPPGPVAGGTGYRFKVETALPFIMDGANFVASRYSLATADDIKSGTELLCQRVASLKAIVNSYAAQSRKAGDKQADDFTAQRALYQAELDEALKVLDPLYGVYPNRSQLDVGPLGATIFAVNRGRCSRNPEFGAKDRGCW